jgi:SNF2 family DNA or RNA helicase
MEMEPIIYLNGDSPKIEQPVNLNINLMEHQKASIKAMINLEETGVINKSSKTIYTSMGILGDVVGSGKSYMILSLLLLNNTPKEINNIQNGYKNICVTLKNDKTRLNVTLLFVPFKLITQWNDYFKNAPSLKLYICNTSKKINELTDSNLNSLDVILISDTFFKKFNDKFINYRWSRIIIDEADVIKVSRMECDRASFIWFITATYRNLKACVYKYDIPFVSIGLNLINSLVIQNSSEFIEQSRKLPIPNIYTIQCITPHVVSILQNHVSPEILSMINAGSITDAIKQLKCNVNTKENIIQLVTQNIQINIKNTKIELEAEKQKTYNIQDKHLQENKIKKITETLNSLNTTYNSIKQKISDYNNELCPICMDGFTKPALLQCCNNLFCFECIIHCITKSKNKCPLCRSVITTSDINIIDKKKDDEKKEKTPNPILKIKNKIDSLLEIITSKKNGKIIVFSEYIECFLAINHMLTINNISHCIIKGACSTIQKKINQFENGEIRILMLDAKHFGEGLNLQMTTDVIIYHKMSSSLEKQAIGRAQRIGRTEPLNIYYLLHDNE